MTRPVESGAPAPRPLSRRLLAGGFWAGVDGWASEFANLALYFVLASLLGPAEFGVVAMAAAVTNLATSLLVYAVKQVIIQKPDLGPAHCDAVFLINVGGTTLAAALLIAMAGPIAQLFGEPMLARILPWLTLGMLFQALGAVPLALLTRELRFAAIAKRSLLMLASGGTVGLVLAFQGYGAWALVAQHLVGTGTATLLLLRATDWRPRLRARWSHVHDMRAFMGSAVANQLFLYARERAPTLVIGYVLGPGATGIYNMAAKLVEALMRLFIFPLNQIIMPGFATVQHDAAAVRGLLKNTLAFGAFIGAPAFLGAAALAPFVLGALLDASWAQVAPVFQILLLRGLIWPHLLQAEAMLYGLGRPQDVLRINLADLAVQAVILVAASQLGLLVLAAAEVARPLLWRWPLLARRVAVVTGLGWGEQARPLLLAGLSAAGMAAAVFLLVDRLGPPTLGLVHVAAVPLGVLLYLAFSALINRRPTFQAIREAQLLWSNARKLVQPS